MKKIGIVGGVGWRATVDYYAEICRRGEQLQTMPEVSIESLDHDKAISFPGTDGDEDSWTKFDDYHREALERLEASGAEVAIMASNTPHHRFETIVRGIGIPVIDIFDVTAKECARIGAREVLILGTRLTMSSEKFREAFARYGVGATGPHDDAARAMTIGLISELQVGEVEGAAERIAKIASNSIKGGIDTKPAVCLACTELPLAFPRQKMLATFEYGGFAYINPTVLHINAAFDFAASAKGTG